MQPQRSVAARKIQVPIRTFTHPDGGRVTYFSMVHAGQSEYYATVGDKISVLEARGAIVHYEKVRHPTAEELAAAPEPWRTGAEQIAERLAADREYLVSIGLSLQRDLLVPGDGWENHDLSMLGVARFYGRDILRQQQEQDLQAHGRMVLDGLDPAALRAFLLQNLDVQVKVATGAVEFEMLFRGVERQVAILRETVAFAALDQRRAVEPGADFILVWGAAHLIHFTEGLEERGYKRDGPDELVTVIDPDTLPPLTPQP